VLTTKAVSGQLVIRNKRGHLHRFDRSPSKQQLKMIANCISPPQEITTIEQAKQLLSLVPKDHFVVMAYIPYAEDYQQLMAQRIRS
jgi:hypothetical protein